MNSLTTHTARPRISAHRTRIVADAVVSAYIREISSPQPAAERPVIRALAEPEIAPPEIVPSAIVEVAPRASACAAPRIRVRRWTPPERRGPALEAAA